MCAFCPVCRGAVDIAIDLISLQSLCLPQIKYVAVCIGNGSFMSAFYKILSEGTFDDDHDTFAHLVFLAF